MITEHNDGQTEEHTAAYVPGNTVENGRFPGSLRDWFAGQAMAGMLNGSFGNLAGGPSAYAKGACNSVVADRAYVLADAMLRERAKPQEPDHE